MGRIMLWTVVMPLNNLHRAKSRLTDATATAERHRALVQAMRTDALAACVRARLVVRIVLVTDRETAAAQALPVSPGDVGPEVHVVDDPSEPGLNAAIRAGEIFCARWPGDGIAAVVSDLPCLTGSALDDVLALSAAHPRAIVVDRQGTGTTVLAARPGLALSPQFGAGSAGRHLDSGAAAIAAAAAVRTDVDTAADLAVAQTVGVGQTTKAVLDEGEQA